MVAGSTLTFSGRIRALWERDSKRYKMSLRILKRSLTLFALGIIIASFDLIGIPKEQQWLRVPGVLQRISICYFVLALMVLWMPSSSSATSPKTGSVQVKRRSTGLKNITEITTKPALSFSSALSTESSSVIKYILPVVCTTLWFILTYAVQSTANQPIDQCSYGPEAINITSGDVLPGFAPLAGQLSPQWCTAQAYLDTVLFQRGRNPNNPVFDSEGSVGTLMSIVTGWFGWMMGSSIVEQQRQQKMQEKKRIVEMDDYIASVVAVNATAAGALPHELSLQPDGNKGKEIAADDKRNRLQEQLLTERRSSLLSNLSRWFMTGVCIMYSGEVLGWFLPICKGLWTPSYTLYSAGNSINALCILIFMYDIPSRPASSLPSLSQETLPRSASPSSMREMTKAVFSTSWMLLGRLFGAIGRVCTNILVCYGRNPTLIYVLSEVVKAILDKIRVDGGYDWIQTVMPPAWASFIFSMVYIMIFWPLLWVLNKKALYLRV
ncbi:hypothetical protein BGZ83_012181 [Gryganskiella cystojenkinii]|nr:hypothetical protein BGZ83_012181 [Gryganskiella cystojenkinii]